MSAQPIESATAPPGSATEPESPVIQMQAALEGAFGHDAAHNESVLHGSTDPVFESGALGGVPRISIHVFCELGATGEIVESALKDRRLGRAAGAIFNGGLPAAATRYRSQPTPSLVVVETGDDTRTLLADLDRLAEVCDPTTKVMVIGRHNDISLYREMVRRGVSEYLVHPIDPLALISAVSSLFEDPSAPFAGRSIAVMGAKGGVGSSIIAHNLAYALSERFEANTILVDLDLPFGTGGLGFNQEPLQGVAQALAQPDRLDPVLLDRMMARCTDRLSLFAAPATLDEDYDITAAAYAEVTDKVRGAAPWVVLDMPHQWSTWIRHTLMTADEVVIVAEPDLASLRNTKNLLELMHHGRPNDGAPRLVLNKVGVPGRPEIAIKDFAEAVGLQPTLTLPFDPKLFGQAANNGQMIEEVNAKAKAVEGVNQLARLISRREAVPMNKDKTSLFASLLKRKA